LSAPLTPDGEFGPVYDNASDGPEWKENNERRYNLLKTQLDIYARNNTSWSIWLWKGRCRFVYVVPATSSPDP